MGIPLRYNVRNLLRRKLRTGLTVLGIAMVIAAAVIMLASSQGLLHSLRSSGDPENELIISRKAMDREFSSMKRAEVHVLETLLSDYSARWQPPGEDTAAMALVSASIHHTALVQIEGSSEDRYGERKLGVIQGVDPEIAPRMINAFRLVRGREMRPDEGRVALVGALAYARLGVAPEQLVEGCTLSFNGAQWTIVGVFAAPGTTAESEIWVPRDELAALLSRTDYSFVVVKLEDPRRTQEVVRLLNESERMEFKANTEAEFFKGAAETFNAFALVGMIMAAVITLGGLMAGMNTMFTAVHGRIREIGTLQVLGFSKRAILASILAESLAMALAGGLIGCALGFLVNGMPMRVVMGVFLFRVDAQVMLAALGLSLAIGLLGALVPAWRALKLPMVEAVRFL